MVSMWRSRWAAVGAAVAVSLGAGGIGLVNADLGTGDRPVYVSLSEPCRVVDTRPASLVGPRSTPIGAAATFEIDIAGGSGNCTGDLAVPADALAVSLNVTAIDNTTQSHLRVFPGDADLPTTSNLNFGIGQTPIANKVDVGLSATGTIKIFNRAGATNIAVDVFGYYVGHDHDDRYYTQTEIDTTVDGLSTAIDDLDTTVGDLELDVDRISPARIVWVATDGTGDFSLLSEALAAITDNAADNRYLVRIAPGTYTETSMVTTKPYVDIQGSGLGSTVITCACGDASDFEQAATLTAEHDIEIRDLVVVNTSTLAFGVAIVTKTGAPFFSRVVAQVQNATNGTAIYNVSGSKARFHDGAAVALGGATATAITNAGSGTDPIFVGVEAQAIGGSSSSYGIVNVTFAAPVFRDVTVVAGGAASDNIGIFNVSSASPIIRDSSISSDDQTIANVGGSIARVAGSMLDGVVAGSGIKCVASYTATFTELDQACIPIP